MSDTAWVRDKWFQVESFATAGIDLWRDLIWMNAIFMSAPLANALEAAGLAKPWRLVRWRWATDEDRRRGS